MGRLQERKATHPRAKIKLKTCPDCNSTDITIDKLMGITGNRYKCSTCGYAGDVIVESDVEKMFRK